MFCDRSERMLNQLDWFYISRTTFRTEIPENFIFISRCTFEKTVFIFIMFHWCSLIFAIPTLFERVTLFDMFCE